MEHTGTGQYHLITTERPFIASTLEGAMDSAAELCLLWEPVPAHLKCLERKGDTTLPDSHPRLLFLLFLLSYIK